MTENNQMPKIIKCYEYGELTSTIYEGDETWIFTSNDFESTMINSTLIEALNEMSMEGWDLVCQDGLGFILRMSVEKEEPQPCSDDEEDEDDHSD